MAEFEPAFRGRRPTKLAFGTSGLRGLVSDITDLEAYVNTVGFLEYLVQSNRALIRQVAIGGDLRPSTDSEHRSILRAVARGCQDAGFEVVHCGKLPTPDTLDCWLSRPAPTVRIPAVGSTGRISRALSWILASPES